MKSELNLLQLKNDITNMQMKKDFLEESILGEIQSSEDNNYSRKITALAECIVSLNKAFLLHFI